MALHEKPKVRATKEQKLAIELCENPTTKNVKISAFAGTGKTTTISLIAHALAKSQKRGIYLAFNKVIAEEAGAKMPALVQAKTFHSLAYNSVPKWLTHRLRTGLALYVKNFLQWSGICDSTIVMGDESKTQVNGADAVEYTVSPALKFMIVKRALEYFCRSDSDAPDIQHLQAAADSILDTKLHSADSQILGEVLLPHLQRMWDDMCSPTGDLMISHDVYLKYYALNNPEIKYDFILFDEAQDTDRLMLSILKKQKAPVIFVGDSYQQIYEWRGAKDAMSLFDGAETSLTKSFRFGKNIAAVANAILDHMGSAEQITGGSSDDGLVDYTTAYPQDVNAVLCRTNAGAITAAITYLEANPTRRINLELNATPESILELVDEIEKFSYGLKSNHPVLRNFENIKELETYCEKFSVDDRISGIFRLYKQYGLTYLTNLFNQVGNVSKSEVLAGALTITTVHKAKGREWDNVYLLDDFEGKTFAKDKESGQLAFTQDAESRLLYVAVTRAKSKLYAMNVAEILHVVSKGAVGLPRQETPSENEAQTDANSTSSQVEVDLLASSADK